MNSVISSSQRRLARFIEIVAPNLTTNDQFELIDCNSVVIEANIVVFLVAHKKFTSIEIGTNKIILDFCGIKKTSIQ
ncbi:hypothetical protein OAL09_01875 [Verrucomicrobia bacterium]|nr:hypothetical protein [Verrucomicrobiota bacterium]